MVGRATVKVNALSLFHMKQLLSPALYRWGRGALFSSTVPAPSPKPLFSASARLYPPCFTLVFAFTATRLIGRLITGAERSLRSRLKSGLADRLPSLSGNARSRVTLQSREITRLHSLGYDDYLSPVPSPFFYGQDGLFHVKWSERTVRNEQRARETYEKGLSHRIFRNVRGRAGVTHPDKMFLVKH